MLEILGSWVDPQCGRFLRRPTIHQRLVDHLRLVIVVMGDNRHGGGETMTGSSYAYQNTTLTQSAWSHVD